MRAIIKNKTQIINNGINEKSKKRREILLEILETTLSSVNPKNMVKNRISITEDTLTVADKKIDLTKIDNIYVIGTGKGCGYLSEAIEEILGNRITYGVAAVPPGTASFYHTSKIKIIEGDHPTPGPNSVRAGREIIRTCCRVEENDLVLFLLTGGGSAITALPQDEITLDELIQVNNTLLKCGADIYEINAIRKHITQVSGGRLAKLIYPAIGVSLIVSDVVGDMIDTISSGPTSPDTTTFEDALNVIRKYKIENQLPENVINYLRKGANGKIEETPKKGSKIFNNITNILIGSNINALTSAKKAAIEKKLNVLLLTSMVEGDAFTLGKLLSGIAKEILKTGNPIPRPALIIIGGETTVNVKNGGKGGRNQTVALNCLINLGDIEDVTVCCSSTDGIDGNSDAAGAMVDLSTLKHARSLKIDPLEYLMNFDSNTFFKRVGDVILTGPTGTNVNDVNLVLVM